MAKNTSKKSAKKKNSFFKKISSLKWYTKLFLLIAVSLLLFLAFKEGVNRYNISLLDQAETKMRAMDLPEADHTEYKRSCSFRSVKFGSAGSPMCHIQRIDTYDTGNDLDKAIKLLKDYLIKIESTDAFLPDEDLKKKLESSTEYNIPVKNLVDGLRCGHLVNYAPDYSTTFIDHHYLRVATNCSRRFMFQTYPEI